MNVSVTQLAVDTYSACRNSIFASEPDFRQTPAPKRLFGKITPMIFALCGFIDPTPIFPENSPVLGLIFRVSRSVVFFPESNFLDGVKIC